MRLNAIVLAGGRSSRMGAPKAGLVFEGSTLVEAAVAAARDAGTTVVVGPPDSAPTGVLTAREVPAFGGPAAALAAGVDALREADAPWVLVLACDLPRASGAVEALMAAGVGHDAPGVDGIVAVDDAGRRQPLLALYSTDALAGAVASARRFGDLAGLPLRRLLAGLDVVEVPVASSLCADVDTPEQARSFGIVVAAGTVRS